MDDDDYNFIYGLIEKVRKNVLRKIAQKAQTENEIPITARCNLGAVIRLFKVNTNNKAVAQIKRNDYMLSFFQQLAYPSVDPGDARTQSHIFLDPPVRSRRITFTSTVDLTDGKKVKKSPKSKVNRQFQLNINMYFKLEMKYEITCILLHDYFNTF